MSLPTELRDLPRIELTAKDVTTPLQFGGCDAMGIESGHELQHPLTGESFLVVRVIYLASRVHVAIAKADDIILEDGSWSDMAPDLAVEVLTLKKGTLVNFV